MYDFPWNIRAFRRKDVHILVVLSSSLAMGVSARNAVKIVLMHRKLRNDVERQKLQS